MTHSPQEKIDTGVFSFLASQIRKQAWRANFPEIVHATNYENTFITDPEKHVSICLEVHASDTDCFVCVTED